MPLPLRPLDRFKSLSHSFCTLLGPLLTTVRATRAEYLLLIIISIGYSSSSKAYILSAGAAFDGKSSVSVQYQGTRQRAWHFLGQIFSREEVAFEASSLKLFARSRNGGLVWRFYTGAGIRGQSLFNSPETENFYGVLPLGILGSFSNLPIETFTGGSRHSPKDRKNGFLFRKRRRPRTFPVVIPPLIAHVRVVQRFLQRLRRTLDDHGNPCHQSKVLVALQVGYDMHRRRIGVCRSKVSDSHR